jgi:hypothetical protein
MPVEFISNGYDTTTANPYTEGAWADAHPVIGLAKYGVRSPLDWKVTAVSGQDRTVSIAAGRGFGHGVTDKTFANETIQLDTITSGSRWDLIVCRRDWTPTSGVSKFEKVNGGATAVIPGGRLSAPGGIDDQPIALVQVTSGQTQPTAIIDLRTWSGDGGGLIANHDLVRSYLNSTGTRIWINGADWVRRVGANDTPEWVKLYASAHSEWTFNQTNPSFTSGLLFGSGALTNDSTRTTDTGLVSTAGETLVVRDEAVYDVILTGTWSRPSTSRAFSQIQDSSSGTVYRESASVDENIGKVSMPGVWLTAGAVLTPKTFNIFGAGSTTWSGRIRITKTG